MWLLCEQNCVINLYYKNSLRLSHNVQNEYENTHDSFISLSLYNGAQSHYSFKVLN